MKLTKEQIDAFNEFQERRQFHPLTCDRSTPGCIVDQNEEGLLKATEEGLVCPCGKYTQDWCHSWILDGSANRTP